MLVHKAFDTLSPSPKSFFFPAELTKELYFSVAECDNKVLHTSSFTEAGPTRGGVSCLQVSCTATNVGLAMEELKG